LPKLLREHLQWKRENPSSLLAKERWKDLLFAYPPNFFEVHLARLSFATPQF
jgi:hypothetical protein